MKVLAAEYYELLKQIQDNSISIITPIPSDEPFIEVDLNSRCIVLPPEFKDFLSVERDHRAETVYFRMDRYFDDIDLANVTGVIEYVNAAGEGRIYPITLKDSISQAGKILFAWCIGGEATKLAGNISFAVRFYSVDPDQASFTYNLNTIPAIGIILHGMELVDDNETYDYPAAVISQIYDEIEKAKNKKLYWTDL